MASKILTEADMTFVVYVYLFLARDKYEDLFIDKDVSWIVDKLFGGKR